MNQAASRKLVELRAKTDHQLSALIRTQLQNAVEVVKESPDRATEIYQQSRRLLPFLDLSSADRGRIERLIEELASMLCRRQACA